MFSASTSTTARSCCWVYRPIPRWIKLVADGEYAVIDADTHGKRP